MTGLIVGLFLAGLVIYWLAFSPEAQERARKDAEMQSRIVCQHCQAQGTVTRVVITKKRGISGGKATGAILTGGVSMLGTGLSRKENFTRFTCSNCGTTWDA